LFENYLICPFVVYQSILGQQSYTIFRKKHTLVRLILTLFGCDLYHFLKSFYHIGMK